MDDQPDDDLIRDLYASFGAAYYLSECLHRELCMAFAWSGLPSRDLITRPRVDEQLAEAFSLTLGDVAARLEGVLPLELSRQVQEAVNARNFLAHHFWYERAHLMFSVGNVRQLIVELDGHAEMFSTLDTRLSGWSEPRLRELGVTDEALQDGLRRILAGRADEPLPDRHGVRGLKKKLAKPQRLIRVWQFALDGGRKPLIFELADGSFWQLSDVGLGLTRLQESDPTWMEHPALKPHLPADIRLRPTCAGPWDYEFALANEAVLWVKPGRQKQTFRWGVRTPKMTAEQGAIVGGDSAPPRQ